jgi:hypothetical protein
MTNDKRRFDEIDFHDTHFYGEDGFDIHLSIKFDERYEQMFDIKSSTIYPIVNVSCSAEGEILDMHFDDGGFKFENIELTEEEKTDIVFFLIKHDLVFESATYNEFPIGII